MNFNTCSANCNVQ